jgi:hypothetical protein
MQPATRYASPPGQANVALRNASNHCLTFHADDSAYQNMNSRLTLAGSGRIDDESQIELTDH